MKGSGALEEGGQPQEDGKHDNAADKINKHMEQDDNREDRKRMLQDIDTNATQTKKKAKKDP